MKRDVQSYLFDTLRSLFSNVEASDSFSILIYIGESDVSYVQTLANEIIKTFEKEFDAGKIDIISPPTHYYPNFEKDIEELMSGKTFFNTFGDAPDRIKWRQKQNLGTEFIILYDSFIWNYIIIIVFIILQFIFRLRFSLELGSRKKYLLFAA